MQVASLGDMTSRKYGDLVCMMQSHFMIGEYNMFTLYSLLSAEDEICERLQYQ